MIDKNFSKKILNIIEEKNIKPEPKWKFKIKEFSIWFLLLCSILLGSLSVAFILLEFFNADWDIYTQLTDSFLEYFIAVLPLFWIIFLIFFLFLTYFEFIHTETGYRYNFSKILIINIIISIFLGSAFYLFNFSHYINQLTLNYLDHENRKYLTPREYIWFNNINKGLLAGKLVKVINSHFIKVQDLNKEYWLVNIDNAKIIHPEDIYLNSFIKIIGDIIDENKLRAFEIRPWNQIHFHIFIEEHKSQPLFIR